VKSQQHEQGGGGAGAAVAVLGLVVFFGLTVLWNLQHDYLVHAWLRFNRFLLLPFRSFLSAAQDNILLLQQMNSNIGSVSLSNMLHATTLACRFYLPLALLVPIYGAYASLNTARKFNQSHDADSLLQRLSIVFPYTTPILNKDLNHDDSKEWRSSIKVHIFAQERGLLKNRVLDTTKTAEVFKAQVGRKFVSIKQLQSHEKALFAVFAAKVADNKGQDVLEELSRSTARTKSGNPDYSCADALLADYAYAAKPFTHVHSYVRTLLCSMFEAAKTQGKLSPSMFLWLKPVDRTLWYALNRVGAQTPFVEAVGVWDHWKAEQVAYTGYMPINWSEYLSINEESNKRVWEISSRVFELKEIWVSNAVKGFEQHLFESGIIDSIKQGDSTK
jgi:intracellular multiplication protein IcmP